MLRVKIHIPVSPVACTSVPLLSEEYLLSCSKIVLPWKSVFPLCINKNPLKHWPHHETTLTIRQPFVSLKTDDRSWATLVLSCTDSPFLAHQSCRQAKPGFVLGCGNVLAISKALRWLTAIVIHRIYFSVLCSCHTSSVKLSEVKPWFLTF